MSTTSMYEYLVIPITFSSHNLPVITGLLKLYTAPKMAHSILQTLAWPTSFNFATDVVEYWASRQPSPLAMHWVSQDHSRQRKLTYAHFAWQSHRVAHLLASLGIPAARATVVGDSDGGAAQWHR